MRPESLAGHLYIPGTKKKFQVWYDKIVDFKSFSDRFGIMRVAQSANPRSFRTETGWFAFSLAVNLTHMQRAGKKPEGRRRPPGFQNKDHQGRAVIGPPV